MNLAASESDTAPLELEQLEQLGVHSQSRHYAQKSSPVCGRHAIPNWKIDSKCGGGYWSDALDS